MSIDNAFNIVDNAFDIVLDVFLDVQNDSIVNSC